jgi:hypothetical protein
LKLEDQLAQLATIGLALNPGITVDDVLYSFDRKEYEKRPFDLVLFIFGAEVEREPWGRPFCSRVWNFDTSASMTAAITQPLQSGSASSRASPTHLSISSTRLTLSAPKLG